VPRKITRKDQLQLVPQEQIKSEVSNQTTVKQLESVKLSKTEAVVAYPVRPANEQEQKIVSDMKIRAKELQVDVSKEFARIAIRRDGRLYLIQNPQKASLWAELARKGRFVVQVLSDKDNRWEGVIIETADKQVVFVSYAMQRVQYNKYLSHRYGDWVVISYWKNGQLTGVNPIRMPELKGEQI